MRVPRGQAFGIRKTTLTIGYAGSTIVAGSNSMNTKFALWLFVRALRWLAWIGFFAVAYYIHAYRAEVVTGFGQLKVHIEMLIFGTALAGVFLGLIEMMTRERAGLRRPAFGELIPERVPPKAAAY
jgi:hypothetical protein